MSTHQTYPKTNKNSKETALGKPELFPVQISGKPDTIINRPKKQNTKKSKDINSGKSEFCLHCNKKSLKFSLIYFFYRKLCDKLRNIRN